MEKISNIHCWIVVFCHDNDTAISQVSKRGFQIHFSRLLLSFLHGLPICLWRLSYPRRRVWVQAAPPPRRSAQWLD